MPGDVFPMRFIRVDGETYVSVPELVGALNEWGFDALADAIGKLNDSPSLEVRTVVEVGELRGG